MVGKRTLIRSAVILLFLLPAPASKGQVSGSGSACCDAGTRAGQDPAPYLEKGMNEWSVWGGGSVLTSDLAARVSDLRLGILGLRYARVVSSRETRAVKYTVDAIPSFVMSFPRFVLVPGASPPVFRLTRATVYGAGLAPIGVQMNFRRQHRVEPFANLAGGFIYFAEPVPDGRGAQFNFTFDLGGGVQVFTRSRRAVSFGYRFHHLSNGYRGQINPGFDSHVFYAGFSLFR